MFEGIRERERAREKEDREKRNLTEEKKQFEEREKQIERKRKKQRKEVVRKEKERKIIGQGEKELFYKERGRETKKENLIEKERVDRQRV